LRFTAGVEEKDTVLVLPSASLVQSQQQFRQRFQNVTGGGLPGFAAAAVAARGGGRDDHADRASARGGRDMARRDRILPQSHARPGLRDGRGGAA